MRDMLRTLRLDTLIYRTPDYKNKITYNHQYTITTKSIHRKCLDDKNNNLSSPSDSDNPAATSNIMRTMDSTHIRWLEEVLEQIK
jgi:hypothetical protein